MSIASAVKKLLGGAPVASPGPFERTNVGRFALEYEPEQRSYFVRDKVANRECLLNATQMWMTFGLLHHLLEVEHRQTLRQMRADLLAALSDHPEMPTEERHDLRLVVAQVENTADSLAKRADRIRAAR